MLRNREAIVVAELRRVQARLRSREGAARAAPRTSCAARSTSLRNRLVDIYRSGDPDLLTVMLESDGFDDLLDRYEYLRRIEEQDSSIVGRVRGLRNGTRITVERVTADRDEIAAKKAELERTRAQLEAREAELDAVRDQKAAALDQVQSQTSSGSRATSATSRARSRRRSRRRPRPRPTPLPAGPGPGRRARRASSGRSTARSPRRSASAGGGCTRASTSRSPPGTPIRAAKPGNVILAAYTSGYGNYTCVDHGGGLSSCYAHQSSYAVSVGESVAQGEVIGYVGCTGSCFGDHLHFEIRVNGAAVDPLGYL